MTFLSWGYVVGVICVTLVALTSAPGRFAWSASADCAFACWVGTEPCHGLGRFCSWRRASTVPRMTEPKTLNPLIDGDTNAPEQTACGYDKAAVYAIGIPARISSIRIMVRSRIGSGVHPRRSRVLRLPHLSSGRRHRRLRQCSAVARAPAPAHRTHRGAVIHRRARRGGHTHATPRRGRHRSGSGEHDHAADSTCAGHYSLRPWYRCLIGASVRRTFADWGRVTRTGT